jgi:hypothetical protein
VDGFDQRSFAGAVAENRYTIKNVLSGRYLLIASNKAQNTAASREIEVRQRNLDGMDLTLQPFPDLAGTVTFAKGCLAGPVRIRLFTMLANRVEATSAEDGHFVLHHVPPFQFGIDASGPQRTLDPPVVRLGNQIGGTGMVRFGPARDGESLEIEMHCGDSGRPQ